VISSGRGQPIIRVHPEQFEIAVGDDNDLDAGRKQ
jgi:hypothetical protein